MSKSRKLNTMKPQIFIQIENLQQRLDQFRNQSLFCQFDVQPLRSAKNLHEMKRFEFRNQAAETYYAGRNLNRLERLEEQKMKLIRQFALLKESAVSAIEEQIDEIQKLKIKMSLIQDENLEIFQQKLRQQRNLRLTLQDERNELLKQLKVQRQLHICQLEQKEYIIEQLCTEIAQIRREVEKLEQSDFAQAKQIKLLLEENLLLSEQFDISNIGTVVKQRSQRKLDLNETIKINSLQSMNNTNQGRKYWHFQLSQNCLQIETRESQAQRLQQVQKAHKEQLVNLRTFYENKIQSLKQMYQAQLHLTAQSSDEDLIKSQRSASNCSKNHSQKRKECRKSSGFQLNLNEMYSIEEKVQNQLQAAKESVQNLKNEIKMQNLSECPSVEHLFNTNQDTQSQFTIKYFQISSRFLRKNESVDSIALNSQFDPKPANKKSAKQAKPLCSQSIISKKQYLFGAGFLSGIAITSLFSYLWRR